MTPDQMQARIAELEADNKRLREACMIVRERIGKVAINGWTMQQFLDDGSVREIVEAMASTPPSAAPSQIGSRVLTRAEAIAEMGTPVAVWPRVVQVQYGEIIVFQNPNERGYAYNADGDLFHRTNRMSVESWLADFPADRELHGPEKAAMLNRLGLDENGVAKAKDGE